MAAGGAQPTVMVKRPDGSFVRMTLDEVRKMKEQEAQQKSVQVTTAPGAPLVSQSAVKPVVKQQLIEAPEKELALSAPEAVVSAAAPKPQPVISSQPPAAQQVPVLTKEDATSLLEEPVPQPVVPVPAGNQKREAESGQIIKNLTFTVAPALEPRLRTLVQLYLKDIRSAEETKAAFLRSANDGGVALNDTQAGELMIVLDRVKRGENANAGLSPDVQEKLVKISQARTAAAPRPAVAPSVAPAPAPEKDKREAVLQAFSQPVEEDIFRLVGTPKAKPAMQDVVARPVAMSQADEIRYVNLTDFRRLSTNPEEAALRLRQKFINLKDESILLYLEGLEAWKVSPLYKVYVEALIGSLATGQSLGSAGQREGITAPEIQALIHMEHELEYL